MDFSTDQIILIVISAAIGLLIGFILASLKSSKKLKLLSLKLNKFQQEPTHSPHSTRKTDDSITENVSLPKKSTKSPSVGSSATYTTPSQSSRIENASGEAMDLSNYEYLQLFLKMGDIARDCEEMVEIEDDLVEREKTRLYLKRNEFKKLYRNMQQVNRESF